MLAITKKLFYEDGYRKKFEAVVLKCEPYKEGSRVVLDQTAFFPEGGGQYADRGRLDQSEVVDVQEKEGVIYHTVLEPLEEGRKVTGEIHWEERFEKMQQHTGEHIVCGIVHRRFGYDNVGFHLGNDYCTMDFNGPLTEKELKEVEREANRAVFENLDVEITCPEDEELRRLKYRSKMEIEGQVRIVTIPGYDVCACCAPHVARTGEIGLIKLVRQMHYKGGERITMLCGWRAWQDYDKKDEEIKAISSLLCAKEYETAEAVEQLKEAQGSVKQELAQMQRKMLSVRADSIPVGQGTTVVFDSELKGDAPRELVNLLLERGAEVSAVFAGTDADGYRYVIGSKKKDVRPLGKELNQRFSGRGGGKPEMVQGSLRGEESAVRRCAEGF